MYTQKDAKKINEKLIDILSEKKGYLGRVKKWGQRPAKYEYIGYEMTKDFSCVLRKMSVNQIKSLVKVMNYFVIHAQPARSMLDNDPDKFTAEIAWSHFMTMIMFGMLEVVVMTQPYVKLNKKGYLLYKGEEIKKFLEKNIPRNTKESIVERYQVEEIFNHKKPTNFGEVVDHLWHNIRCGFTHNAGIESKGLEWYTLEGAGSKNDPIILRQDVPMQEWLQVTWQAILNSFGYKGLLELPKYEKINDRVR
ncbi:MAG: hypothetical protein WC422_05220 [Candidatus Paceibacterota bacterium]|jgi:hypothetical protein